MHGSGEDAVVASLAAHDPLLGASWGMAPRPVPSLDPEWWTERLARWRAAASTPDVLLGQVARSEIAWMDAGEFRRSVHATIDSPAFAVRQCLDEVEIADSAHVGLFVSLLDSVPVALHGLTATLREGIAVGQVAARRQVLATAAAARGWSEEDFSGRVPARVRASLPATLERELAASVVRAADAFGSLARFLEADYAPAARAEDAAGREGFLLWASRYFAEAPAVEDWYDWACAELSDTFRQLGAARRLASEAGPSRQLVGAEAHRDWAQSFIDNAIAQTKSIVGLPAGTSGPRVRLMPGDLGSLEAYYSPPTIGSSEPGTVWIEGGDGPHFIEYEKVVLAHEGVPGHHIETTHQRQSRQLTEFQRLAYLPAHSEGWGLYAEQLADEAGSYDTPHARAGYLGSLALRVASAVIDIGVHCQLPQPDTPSGWTIDSAVETLEAIGLSPAGADSWMNTILGRPGHRSTYAIGKRAWIQARQAAAADGLTTHDFHIRALAQGPCPISELGTAGRA